MDAWPCAKIGCANLATALIRYDGQEFLISGVIGAEERGRIAPQVRREIVDTPTCSDHMSDSMKTLTELGANPKIMPLNAPLPEPQAGQAVLVTQDMPKIHEIPDRDGPWRQAVDDLRERCLRHRVVGPPETTGPLQEATILDWSIRALVHEMGDGARRGGMWMLLAERPGEAKRIHVDAVYDILDRLGVPTEFRRPIMHLFEDGRTIMNFGWVKELDETFVPRVKRCDPCPCGSGQKYKKCCARKRPA